jgi:hypothetical protein
VFPVRYELKLDTVHKRILCFNLSKGVRAWFFSDLEQIAELVHNLQHVAVHASHAAPCILTSKLRQKAIITLNISLLTHCLLFPTMHSTSKAILPSMWGKEITNQTPWPESASELYRPSDRRLLAKLVPSRGPIFIGV